MRPPDTRVTLYHMTDGEFLSLAERGRPALLVADIHPETEQGRHEAGRCVCDDLHSCAYVTRLAALQFLEQFRDEPPALACG